ncbi:MAG: lysylphosphatidylglycerol synthase transmembrane domain-containing protein [Chloroflexi bacterium]|nr:lysylphosphatidylglycerol synthase transmembrane domain-containing protein [Chloroflexota bacterium]
MRHLRIWIGTAISLVFLVFLFRSVDPADLLREVARMDGRWLGLALIVFALSIAVRVARWRTILAQAFPPIPFADAGELLVIGAAANNILPARTGEVVRAVLLQRRHGGSTVTALGTIVVERVFDGLVLALMLSATLAYLGSNAVLQNVALLAGVAFGGVALALVALALTPRFVRSMIDAVLSILPTRIGAPLRALTTRLLDGLTLLGGPRTWGLVALLSVATWVLDAAAYWLVGIAFGLQLPLLVYLAVCGAANLTVAVPSTSGSIGPYEFLAREVVVYFGASIAAGTAYAIVVHAFVLVPVTLAGVLLLWRRDLGLGDLARAGEATMPEPARMNAGGSTR